MTKKCQKKNILGALLFIDHGDAQSAAGMGGLGPHAGGGGHAMIQVPVYIVSAAGTEQMLTLIGNAVDVAQVGIGPAAAALHPDALVNGIDLSGAVETPPYSWSRPFFGRKSATLDS